jgi:glucose-6-phosphate dehydrogenase assembly protein OpcA
MTITAPLPVESFNVPLREVEHELARQLHAAHGDQVERPTLRSCMSNLVIYCSGRDFVDAVQTNVPAIVALHPARVLLLISEPGKEAGELTASAAVRGCRIVNGQGCCSEQVTLHATGQTADRLPFVVRGLLIGDLPTNLWWASTQPPSLAGQLLNDLAGNAQQIIYDSLGWPEPARGVGAAASWLNQVERGPGQGGWRVVADLSWRRLKYWRRLLSQAFDPATAPGALESITEVHVEHGPHAVIQAWELVSWLTSRLGWRVHEGRVQPGVEIAWHFQAAHGTVPVRICRLADGPTEVRRVRVACVLDGKPVALNIVVEDERRLAVSVEGIEVAPRTITVQSQTLADLIGRQLSDRERDPVFRESMAAAQLLAQSLLV